MKSVHILGRKVLNSPLSLRLSWLEHLTVNQRVPGSSPGRSAKESSNTLMLLDFCFLHHLADEAEIYDVLALSTANYLQIFDSGRLQFM